MKQSSLIVISISIFLSLFFVFNSHAENAKHLSMHSKHGNTSKHCNTPNSCDKRTSLGLPPKKKLHQLSMMRSHLEAVEEIVGLISESNFEEASQVAHTKLGLTDEMKKMCSMFKNTEFKDMGYAFHKSGDALGEALKSKDIKKSLTALNTTLGKCTSCHRNFRQ